MIIVVLAMLAVANGITETDFNPLATVTNGVKTQTVALLKVTNEMPGVLRGIGGAADRVVGQVVTGVEKEGGAVVQPVESVVLTTATSQCALVKQVLGIDSYAKNSYDETELNQLTLNRYSPEEQVMYNLSDAARLLPAAQHYDPELPLIIFAHGFTSSPTSDTFTAILDAFNKKGKYNVLALDSSAYIGWFYLRSSTYVRFIGEKLGQVLAAMVQRGLDPKAVHLIGHSLGAHISGFTGKEFTRLTGQRLGRISGLDPAGPCFYDVGSNLKLNATDADFVDVIHTTHGSLGITEPIGHVDFYPNGGTQQPECVLQTCSHTRAWELYVESIVDERAFPSVRCTGWDQFRNKECERDITMMGYGCSPAARGWYFLQTRGDSPYGLGDAGAEYSNDEGILKSIEPLGPGALFG